MLVELVARELIGDQSHRTFRSGFEQRIARCLSEQLTSRPGSLEESLRLFIAIEQELAADRSCTEAAGEWTAFLDTLVQIYGRAHHCAGRSATRHQRSSLEAVDTKARVDPVKPKPTDVPAGPFARFVLQGAGGRR